MSVDNGRAALLAACAVLGLAATGCGGTSEPAEPAAEAPPAETAELTAIKDYLVDHTERLTAETAQLSELAQEYYELAESYDFDYAAMLEDDGPAVEQLIEASQATFKRANPAYEEAEGIVAGVEDLAEYDVILDAGSSGENPESAVPFDLELVDGTVLEQPGNFFFLTETALWGTNERFAAEDVEPDLDGDGEVVFGEALPDANFYLAAAQEFDRYANELDTEAKAFEPTPSDALSAVVIMTPTMSEYFEAWKNSRFIAGEDASEEGFVATSRLSDITDILSGLVVVYEQMEPTIAEADPAQAKQTGESLVGLRDFAADLRDQEADGKKFTPEDADALGTEAQERAEAIAGQVSQAGGTLEIEINEG